MASALHSSRLPSLAVAARAVLASSHRASADFYKGRNIDLYVGYSVGGAYDLYARVLARHMGGHIPGNPTLVPQEHGGRRQPAARQLALSCRAEGRLGDRHHRPRHRVRSAARSARATQFDAQKFTWIGSANNEVSVCVAMKDSGITKFEDLFTKELTVGGTGTSADTDQFPRVLNGVLGTHFKIVNGYPGGNDVVLAMERGEVQGRCGWSWSSVKSTHQSGSTTSG